MKTGREKEAGIAAPDAERLQKVLAGAGLGSRRALERLIAEGAVQVNGKKAGLGGSVRAGDRIRFRERDWLVIAEGPQQRTLIYNKPEGEVTTRADPEGRPTVFDRLPVLKEGRWVAVGRLDINTTGLLLLTTDGELANAMMHPSNQVDREYVCRIRGQVTAEQVEKLRQGVQLDDGRARFSDIQRMPGTSGNQWFQVTLLEGRNREVRRLWESQGAMVSRLKRVRYGAARLPRGLRVGRWFEISPRDHVTLRQDVRLPPFVSGLTLKETSGRGEPARQSPGNRRPKPGVQRSGYHTTQPGKRRVSKPGSPAGAGRRPHPRSRRSQRS